VHYKSRIRSFRLTPNRRRLCRPLIRSSFDSFAIHAIKRNSRTRATILKVIGEIVHTEVVKLCSDDFNSIMKQKDVTCYQNMEKIMEKIHEETKINAPTLYSLIQACLKTKGPRVNTKELIAVVVSIFCKHHRPEVCLLQRIFSLVLYVGHASKQVSKPLCCNILQILYSYYTGFSKITKNWDMFIPLKLYQTCGGMWKKL